jgi:hypothetical protein
MVIGDNFLVISTLLVLLRLPTKMNKSQQFKKRPCVHPGHHRNLGGLTLNASNIA